MRTPTIVHGYAAVMGMLMLLAGWAGLGCQTTHSGASDPSMRDDPPASSDAGNAAEGEKLFHSQGCSSCHKVNGQGGNVGPDLSNIANAGHSRQWLAQQIRAPKSHKPSTVMPSFSNLSDQQVNDLVAYLMTLSTKK